jgi:outer membrane protein assembly factor BamE (lipoprotein component of BamABCDE complex)
MTLSRLPYKSARNRKLLARFLLVLACSWALAGCGVNFAETLQRGYVLQEGTLEQIPVGTSQEQVLIVLGTPSTVATVSGEVFY